MNINHVIRVKFLTNVYKKTPSANSLIYAFKLKYFAILLKFVEFIDI